MLDQYAAIPPHNDQTRPVEESLALVVFPTSIFVALALVVVAIRVTRHVLKEWLQKMASTKTDTTNNVATVRGNGNISINTGSNSTVNVIATPSKTQAGESLYGAARIQGQTTDPLISHLCNKGKAVVSVVSRPLGRFPRSNTKIQASCRKLLDNLAQLSGLGRIAKCDAVVAKLKKIRTDPDSQITLRHAATINAINAGDFGKAYRLLGEVEVLLLEMTNEDEHRIAWFQHKSVAKMWEGKHAAGIHLTEEALGHVGTMSPGCISAWLLINHALFLTKIAADEDNINERSALTKKAERFYQLAIEHAREEYPGQMPHFQSRVPQFAYTGLALLYLGCWESTDSSRLGICTTVLPDDIKKARNSIAAVEKEGPGCNVIKFLLTVAKACLQHRLDNHQDAYELARQAKDLATKHSFTNFVKFSDNIIQYLQRFL